jgi:hypothetical protein
MNNRQHSSKKLLFNPCNTGGIENEEKLKDELLKKNKEKIFYLKVSNASPDLSEIKGFIYGGISSRFWVLRKHINSIN